MPEDELSIRAAVTAAVLTLIEADKYLLDVECSERSVTHQLAVQLIRHFPGHHIDCEYNRDGIDVKRLHLPSRAVEDSALDAVTVFPDIIVHERGTNANNLLVIEVKKASSPVDHSYDLLKLQAFKAQMAYTFAVHIVIGYKQDGSFANKQQWV